MHKRNRRCKVAFCWAGVLVGAVVGSVRADGVHIGRSVDGQLVAEVEAEFADLIPLDPIAPGGLFAGWSGNNPGFTDALDADAGFLPLEPGANVWLEVVSFDPAFAMIDASFSVLTSPGDETFIGDQGFDTHLTFLVDSADPLFDPAQTVWQATFFLRDDGTTGYAPSDPVTLTFTNVPEPATFGLLAAGAIVLSRRRRSRTRSRSTRLSGKGVRMIFAYPFGGARVGERRTSRKSS